MFDASVVVLSEHLSQCYGAMTCMGDQPLVVVKISQEGMVLNWAPALGWQTKPIENLISTLAVAEDPVAN